MFTQVTKQESSADVWLPSQRHTTRQKAFNTSSLSLHSSSVLEMPSDAGDFGCLMDKGPLGGPLGSSQVILPRAPSFCPSLYSLEEGGIGGKGTCESEVFFSEHTVHALWQGFGVGCRPWHSGPQDELPACRRWEVGH